VWFVCVGGWVCGCVFVCGVIVWGVGVECVCGVCVCVVCVCAGSVWVRVCTCGVWCVCVCVCVPAHNFEICVKMGTGPYCLQQANICKAGDETSRLVITEKISKCQMNCCTLWV